LKNGKLYLQHVLECADRIEKYTAGGKKDFVADQMIQDAVVRNLQILSESIQRLTPLYQTKYPDIPWKNIGQFRNVIVHDYLGIDVDVIWDILEKDLSSLKASVKTILDKEK
jgi:uncharacterized protein with HEPN domain